MRRWSALATPLVPTRSIAWSAPALSPQDALAAAIAGNAYAAPTEMPAGAVHADEIERTYGSLTCKALPALMEWLALRSDLDSLAGETHAITMMTIHSAKGLEFPAVFVAGMEEGIFPHVHDFGGSDDPGKLEEERRLAYVAITRARKRLFLTYAATRRTYGSTSANPRSRFLNEIPFEDIEFSGIGSAGFEGTGWEKRGDRHGTFGSGMGSDMYGGKVFGSHTRSTGGSGSRGGSSFDDFFGGSSLRHRAPSWGLARRRPCCLDLWFGRAASQKAVSPRCPRRWSARSIAPAHRRTLPQAIP